jgi:hypothetical protein
MPVMKGEPIRRGIRKPGVRLTKKEKPVRWQDGRLWELLESTDSESGELDGFIANRRPIPGLEFAFYHL